VLFDDGANAQKAAEVAEEIIAAQPRCVVGHFASAAVQAAAPLYQRHGVALLLPAATMGSLTTEFSTCIRVCDTDQDYALWLCQELKQRRLGPGVLASDGSSHGASVLTALSAALDQIGAYPVEGLARIYSGNYASSVQDAAAFAQDSLTLVLTDDAASPCLARDIDRLSPVLRQGRQIYVAALRPRPQGTLAERMRREYGVRYGHAPGSYFWETVAALQIAASHDWRQGLPLGQSFETVLGPLSIGADRECRPRSFALERVALVSAQSEDQA
jgi:hypothetical protein